jgi:hypothetical protein
VNAPEAVTPVTLWRGDHYEGDSFFLSESKHQRREEWKALPAAQYAELVAYAKTGEAVEGVLIEANEDDGTMTPADVVRALVAERDALREALAGLVADILRRHPDDDYPALVNARTALGAERG